MKVFISIFLILVLSSQVYAQEIILLKNGVGLIVEKGSTTISTDRVTGVTRIMSPSGTTVISTDKIGITRVLGPTYTTTIQVRANGNIIEIKKVPNWDNWDTF